MSDVEVFGLYGQLNLDVYTVEDLSLRFGVSIHYFRNLVKDGKIKFIDLGGPAGMRFRREWVIEWLENNASMTWTRNRSDEFKENASKRMLAKAE